VQDDSDIADDWQIPHKESHNTITMIRVCVGG